VKADPSLTFHIRYRRALYDIESAPASDGGSPFVVRVSKGSDEVWSLDKERRLARRGVVWTMIACRLGWQKRRPYIVVFGAEGYKDILYALPLFTAQQAPRPVCGERQLKYFAKQFRCFVHRAVVVEWRRAA
jgi:hypothetical protein